MANVFDVDKYLIDNEIEVKLNGKSFKVSDISDDVRSMMMEENQDVRKVTQLLVGCTNEDLAKYGVAALGAIIKHVSEALFPQSSPASQ